MAQVTERKSLSVKLLSFFEQPLNTDMIWLKASYCP